jgi:hypothetical protein
MNTQHPYLDLNENPCAALFRLLQLIRDHIPEKGAIDLNEAQLAEAITYHANQAHEIINEGMAGFQQLMRPTLETCLTQPANISNLFAYLCHEVNSTKLLADTYHGVMTDFCGKHPDLAPLFSTTAFAHERYAHQVQEQSRALMAMYDKHYYYPLGRMMQLLPGDITNVPSLTLEEGRMCEAVSLYANQAQKTIEQGLRDIEKLADIMTVNNLGGQLPDMTTFITYLETEAEFMEGNMTDYGSAAGYIKRKIP